MLVIAPWSTFWERNLLVETFSLVGGVMRLATVRGAVSGIGVVNLCVGVWELVVFTGAAVRRLSMFTDRSSASQQLAASAGCSDAARGEDTRRWAQKR